MTWTVELRRSLYLPQVDWYLDAREARDRSFVSHAHSDHVGSARTLLCSEGTAALVAARYRKKAERIVLPFGQPYELSPDARVTLYPAGHILGSAQWFSETEKGTLLYTGDFKLRPGYAAEPCVVPRADVLIMETTFGIHRYRFPPAEQIMAAIISFCRDALAAGVVPVLFAYSLGKSQELLAGLFGSELPVALHPETAKMTAVYESLGVRFPSYRVAEGDLSGHVLICPPQGSGQPWFPPPERRRTAIVSGWALDSGAIYRYRCDAAFPLSDHADFPDLLAFVEQVRPRIVYTVHGFACEFAQTLRSRGIEAWALGRENQLELGLFSA